MTDLDLQASAIAAILGGDDMGMIYDTQPAPRGNDYATFVKKFVTEIDGKVQIRAWTVTYLGETREWVTITLGSMKVLRRVNWLVRCLQSWDDTSEYDFRALVEVGVRALDTNRSLNGTVLDHTACAVTTPNQGQGVVIGDYGCHLAEIRFSATTEETLNSQ